MVQFVIGFVRKACEYGNVRLQQCPKVVNVPTWHLFGGTSHESINRFEANHSP